MKKTNFVTLLDAFIAAGVKLQRMSEKIHAAVGTKCETFSILDHEESAFIKALSDELVETEEAWEDTMLYTFVLHRWFPEQFEGKLTVELNGTSYPLDRTVELNGTSYPLDTAEQLYDMLNEILIRKKGY